MHKAPVARMIGCLALIGFTACAKVAERPGDARATGGATGAGGFSAGTGGRLGGTIGVSPVPPTAPAQREIVAPSLPPGTAAGFANAPSRTTGTVKVVYPSPEAAIPRDLAPIDVQWTPVPAATAYRVSLSAVSGDRLTAYVTANHFLPDAADWKWILSRAAGASIEVQVEAAALDGTGTPVGAVSTSAPQRLVVSRDDATGALFYFGTTGAQGTGSGTLYRLAVGATSPTGFVNGTITNGLCVGCHTITRDGKRMSFAYQNALGTLLGTPMTLGNVDVTNPAQNLAPANTPSAVGTFNPDGTLLLTSYRGTLTLRDGVAGTTISNVVTSGLAMFPDWSPDGTQIVFVRPRAACTPGGLLGNWGQDSVVVIGGALVTMDYDPASRTFRNEQVVLPADNRSAYYPSYSPDGAWIAFTRNDGVTKSSWSGANSACMGTDGSGFSYDNPSAMTWLLPTTGGPPIELVTANGESMRTNSWPKWGPRKDGEYLWLSFTSTRAYGNVLTGPNAHHQLWIAGIRRSAQGFVAGDPSTPAVWFPFQDTVTKNHVGMWSVSVPTFIIE